MNMLSRSEEIVLAAIWKLAGDAYGNAMAESFFASLECELLDRRAFETKAAARLALFTYIEGWYNPRRRHSGLGRIAPAEFERRHAAGQPAQSTLEATTEPA